MIKTNVRNAREYFSKINCNFESSTLLIQKRNYKTECNEHYCITGDRIGMPGICGSLRGG
jgi:hypothetical protein